MSANTLIPWQRTLEGAMLAVDNAERLAEDARLLGGPFGVGRYQTAFSLALLAWEETNKAGLLLKAYLEKHDITENEWRKVFQNHAAKLMADPAYYHTLYPQAARNETQKPAVSVQDFGKFLDLEKQLLGFYVDFDDEKGRWRSPNALSKETVFTYLKTWTDYYCSCAILVCSEIRTRISQVETSGPSIT